MVITRASSARSTLGSIVAVTTAMVRVRECSASTVVLVVPSAPLRSALFFSAGRHESAFAQAQIKNNKQEMLKYGK